MQIRRKKNKQAKRAKRNHRKYRAAERAREPEYIDIVIGHYGPASGLFDDCPICQALLASGETIYTIDEYGEVVPMAAPVGKDRSIN